MTHDPRALPLTDGVVLLDRFTGLDVDELWAGEDNHYVRQSSLPGPFTRRDVADRIAHWQRQWERGGPERSFAIREAGACRLVGGCVLDVRPGDGLAAELTYWVFPPHRRRGYATRAVELASAYAFEDLGVERVELYIEPTNVASLRVAARAGFVPGHLPGEALRCRDGRAGMVRFTRFRTDRVPVAPAPA